MFDKKAQGAIEYLLIIGVAILVVSVVIIAITSITSSANKNVVDDDSVNSIYKGLTEVIDASKSTVFLVVRLNEGENSVIFQSEFSSNKLKDIFKKLPIDSQVKFKDSADCGVVDANKRETVWEPNGTIGYIGDNADASECNVPQFSQIIINVPQDTNLEVKENILEEPIVLDNNPYIINNCYELQNMKNDLAGNYTLGENIDCSMTKNWNDGNGFEPVGKYPNNPFIGNFDGENFKISNLRINRPNENNVGLFGYIKNKNQNKLFFIKNLILNNHNIYGKAYVGGLVGATDGNSMNYQNIIIENISISGKIEGKEIYVGGLIGNAYGSNINRVKIFGEISSVNNYVGGLVGDLKSSDINNSSNFAKVVSIAGYKVGGLAGRSNPARIYQSYSVGDITGSTHVGGLVGDQNGSSSIYDSYSSGTVNGTDYIGGLIGLHVAGSINYSYFNGRIIGTEKIGGLIGYSSNPSNVNSSYWDINKSNLITSAGGTGLHTYQMKNSSNYPSWGFSTIWAIDDTNQINNGYPYLINNSHIN